MKPTSTQTGVAASSARPIDSMPEPLERQHGEPDAGRGAGADATAAPREPRRAGGRRRLLRLQRGQPLAAGARGPGSAGVTPARSAARAMPASGRGTASACS